MRVHHLAFRTADLGRLEQFYVEALGLAVIKRQEARSVWLDADGLIVMLELRAEGEPETNAASREMVAFAVAPGTREDHTARLLRAGATVEDSTDFTLYARDPDGRRIGLSSYPLKLT